MASISEFATYPSYPVTATRHRRHLFSYRTLTVQRWCRCGRSKRNVLAHAIGIRPSGRSAVRFYEQEVCTGLQYYFMFPVAKQA